MKCSACGSENRPGRRFCAQCGAALEIRCGACGASNEPGDRFCGECGAGLGAGTSAQAVTDLSAPPAAERRLVSVLFADLVGFTTLSEHRDPEEVRELLSRYFERCRTLIERYGGTVEKFIGDAVMAVWGTPIAREDDPERAVRAALSLIQNVSALGEEVGMPDLRLRAGVLTGSAAVEVGAEAEGMVLGDTVNTASRLQSIATPGTVLVDDVTRRASEAAIAYEDAGLHEVKGREQPVHAWTALRVVAGVRGVRRSAGLEAPFVGRAAQLELVISASEEAAAGRARVVTIVGDAGAGKSRLLWEFYKYLDGIQDLRWWHQGRCLSYGEGVAYWALAEMVKARAGIVEEEDSDAARAKLKATVEQHIADERERRLVEPRLAHLLGLEQRSASDRADLFSGWRLFFERLADQAPVILAFEDLQWADSGLLEFIDYLLEWSADHPVFVLALGRPELLEARPEWREHAIELGGLSDAAMRDVLEGLVPGLPEDLTARILRQAEGVPLYAVETVRMLLDRRLVAEDGNRYVVTGDIGELEVPETLHALAAARLDELSPAERAVIQDASVFGQSFTPAGVAALGTRPEAEVQRILDGLVAKQILELNEDPLSAERGQYHFLQGLLRTTAYGTLSRRDRKERHLAAARHLQEAWGEDSPELAELLAAHFLDAADADPDASDAPRIRASACETLAEAGRRALSLALGQEAQRAFDRAAELTDDQTQKAALLEQAGKAAISNADFAAAHERLELAIELYTELGDQEAVAHTLEALTMVLRDEDRLEEAIELGRRGVAGLREGSAEKAAALAEHAINLAFGGEFDEAFEAADAALTIAEPLEEWRTILLAFNALSQVRYKQGRVQEQRALRTRFLELALENDQTQEAPRGYNNLANFSLQTDRFPEALEPVERGLELARSRGDRRAEQMLTLMLSAVSVAMGRWDQLPPLEEDGLPKTSELMKIGFLAPLTRVQAGRGDFAALRRTLEVASERRATSNVEFAAVAPLSKAIALRALGRDAEALEEALPVALGGSEVANEDRREAYLEAGLAALSLGDEATVERLIAGVEELAPAFRSPLLRSAAARFEGLLAARRGDLRKADERLSTAIRELRGVEAPFNLGQTLIDHAEVLRTLGREEEAGLLLAEARPIFSRLRAVPWLERIDELESAVAA